MFSERQYNYSPRFKRRQQEHSIVTSLIIANVVVFLLQMLTQGRTMDSGLTPLIWLSSENLKNFEVWRLGTYMFAHGGLLHILANMWMLYIFGKPLEYRIGGNRFLNLYFLSGLIGVAIWLLFNWTGQPILGASGAVVGVLVAAAMLFPNQQYMLLIPPVPIKLKTLALVFGGLQVMLALSGSGGPGGNVAYIAHLGGMLGGFIYIRWFFKGKPRRPKSRRRSSDSFTNKFRDFFYQTGNTNSKQRGTSNTSRKDQKYKDEDFTSEDVDRILDKIGRSGLSSLTQRERHILEKARDKLKDKH